MQFPAFRSTEWIQQQLNNNQAKSNDTTESSNDSNTLKNFTSPTTSNFEHPRSSEDTQINTLYKRLIAPPEVLKGADLSPRYMLSFESVGLYPKKVQAIHETLRQTLFRQALFKIQNVEVMHLSRCKSNRILKHIQVKEKFSWEPFFFKRKNQNLFHEEVWSIDRCGVEAQYTIQYFKEGGNGFSTRVWPKSLLDKWKAFRYYYSFFN